MSADDDLRRAKCASKIAYESAGEARRVMLHVAEPHRKRKGPTPTAYLCPFCGKYHLGRDFKSNGGKFKH